MAKKYVSLSKLQTFLNNLKGTFASVTHSHKLSDITDYTVDNELSSISTNPVQNKVIDAEFDAIATAMEALETAIDGKSDSSHNHDDRYYTESEIDTKLSTKSDTSHNHDSDYDAKGSASAVQTNLNTVSDTLDTHTKNTNIHVTTTNKSDWNTAYTHSQAAHARADATKVADSTTNGNILINDTETNVYSHPNSGVSAGTYKSVTVNAQGHITAGSNPTTLAGYGITDAEAKGAASAALTSAKEYTDTVASGKSDTTHNHNSDYDAKGSANDALASAKSYTDTKTSGLASTSTVDTKISTHNTSTSAHNDIRELISGLTTRLNTLANSDDTTLDQMSEIVAYIKNNKSLIDGITTSKVNVSDIVNNLTTNVTNKPLSAAQGVAIKSLIDALQSELDSHTHTVSNITDLTATATELNYMDGVTSNVQTQLDTLSSNLDIHTHSGSDITSGTVSADRLPKASASAAGIVSTGSQTFAGTKTFNNQIVASGGLKTGGLISSDTPLTDSVGSASYPFKDVYTKNIYLYETYGNNNSGVFMVETEGTTTTEGVTKLKVGNSTAKGNNSNATGFIEVYNSAGGYAKLKAGHSTSSFFQINLPTKAGTIATTDVATQSANGLMSKADKIKLDGATTTALMTTAEYTALEEAGETNANTLYMLTDAEEEEEEFITAEDIDNICGVTF